MIRHTRDASEPRAHRTVRKWKHYCRFHLRTLLLAASAFCVFAWITPHLFKWESPPDLRWDPSLPRVAVAQFRGKIPIEDVTSARRAGRIIVDQRSWARLWAILKPDHPPLEIDFAKEFALVSIGHDPTDVELRIDEGGHLHVWEWHRGEIIAGPPEGGFVVTVVQKKGIKSLKDGAGSSAVTLARFR